MNYRNFRLFNIFYSALTGLSLGLFLALLAAQWTWLELRVNTGLLIPAGLLVGLIIGLVRLIQHPFLWGAIAVGAPWLTGLILAQGNPSNLWILTGSMFREGILLPSLSLNSSNAIVLVLAFVTLITAYQSGSRRNHSHGRCSGPISIPNSGCSDCQRSHGKRV